MKVDGITLFQMIKDGTIKDRTIIKNSEVKQSVFNFEYIDEYYIYNAKEKKFHRCDKNLKPRAKGQPRFMNYETLYKEFELIEPKEEDKDIEELDTTTNNTLLKMECYIGIPEQAEDWNFNILKSKVNELVEEVNKLKKEVNHE